MCNEAYGEVLSGAGKNIFEPDPQPLFSQLPGEVGGSGDGTESSKAGVLCAVIVAVFGKPQGESFNAIPARAPRRREAGQQPAATS